MSRQRFCIKRTANPNRLVVSTGRNLIAAVGSFFESEWAVNDRRKTGILPVIILAVLTVGLHLGLGLYYATQGDPSTRISLRASGAEYLASFPGWNGESEHDSAAYNRAAISVLETRVPRGRSGALFVHAPVYAYFLAGCYAVGGIRLLSVAVPQAL